MTGDNTNTQGSELQEENRRLRQQLANFLREARANEEKLRRFQVQELKLLSLNSLREVIDTLTTSYRDTFDLARVTLALLDDEHELRNLLHGESADLLTSSDLIFFENVAVLEDIYEGSTVPLLNAFQTRHHSVFFPSTSQHPASIALLPLVRQGQLIGSLNLASEREDRFIAGKATDFLERLAAIVSVCLENAINHERLERVGLTDPLTEVNNRRFFDQRLHEEVNRAQRHKTPLSCLFVDVDHFKSINDSYGHPAGDLVLCGVAATLKQQMRCQDVLARYGGEEFAALLTQADLVVAKMVAERIRATLEQQKFILPDGRELQLTVSIGVAVLQPEQQQGDAGVLGETLVDQADRALYQAKHGGRNRVTLAR